MRSFPLRSPPPGVSKIVDFRYLAVLGMFFLCFVHIDLFEKTNPEISIILVVVLRECCRHHLVTNFGIQLVRFERFLGQKVGKTPFQRGMQKHPLKKSCRLVGVSLRGGGPYKDLLQPSQILHWRSETLDMIL